MTFKLSREQKRRLRVAVSICTEGLIGTDIALIDGENDTDDEVVAAAETYIIELADRICPVLDRR